MCIILYNYIQQLFLAVHQASSLAITKFVYLKATSVTMIMTVEIAVMKMDVVCNVHKGL